MNKVLALTDNVSERGITLAEATDAWSGYLGAWNVLLIKSTDRARKLLMAAFGLSEGEPVGIPANTRRPLSEAVKRSKGKPLFVELDRELNFVPETPGLDAVRLVWSQPVAGMQPPAELPGKTMFVDYGFNLPRSLPTSLPGVATVWGLHLSSSLREDGALIAIHDDDLYARATDLLNHDEDLPDLDRAMAQLERLSGPDGVAARQMAIYDAALEGLDASGALPVAPLDGSSALPFGLIIRIPYEADIATFMSYVRNELVPLDWLPEIQPMFYVVNQVTRDRELTSRTASNLARWVVSPLGPDFVDDEITHAVLGPVKAAEYTGVRWYTDPERARWYNDLMLEWYGLDHDAYHCAFMHRLPELAAMAGS